MSTDYQGGAPATAKAFEWGTASAPEYGPRVLMFSGGSAFHALCGNLKAHTANSVHLLTPFDSGGSSAALRQAFAMPAVGDLRQRLMALADDSILGYEAVCQLCAYRLSLGGSDSEHRRELAALVAGEHALTSGISSAQYAVIARLLRSFLAQLPSDFELQGACIGNLLLAGGYLESGHDILGAVAVFSELVSAQGIVRPIVNDHAHLFAELESGRVLMGQHELTGKETPPIESPVRHLFLSRQAEHYEPARVVLGDSNRALVTSADLICFAPGSFYSSLIANLLPEGVGAAIAASRAPKVFIPNLGVDPEQLGMSFQQSLSVLLRYLMQDAPKMKPADVLTHVITDTQHGLSASSVNRTALRELGIELIDLPLVTPQSSPYYDNAKLLQALLSIL